MLRIRIFALLLSLPAGSASAAILAPQTVVSPTIPASHAAAHLNEVATVCGAITGKHTVAGVGTLMDLDGSSPRPTFRIILWESDKSRVGNLPSAGNICVTGVIGQAQGVPQIVLSDATNWALSETPPPAVRSPAPARAAAAGPSTATAPTQASASSSPGAPNKIVAPSNVAARTNAVAPTNAASSLKPAVPDTAAAPDEPAVPGTAAASAPVSSAISPANSASYRIGPDDSLQITVWQEPTLSGTFLVRPDGMISLVLLGDVSAAGNTPMQLAADLKERLKKFLQDPLVAVTVQAANSQKIYLMGEVNRVGPLEMATTMSPLQAIAAAGGLTAYANKKKIYILRGPADKQRKIPFDYKAALKGNPNAVITLLAGDTIVVP
jgi:polysaccharide export outer membrane protein